MPITAIQSAFIRLLRLHITHLTLTHHPDEWIAHLPQRVRADNDAWQMCDNNPDTYRQMVNWAIDNLAAVEAEETIKQ